MENDKRPIIAAREFSFTDQVKGVEKNLVSGSITKQDALFAIAVHAFQALIRVETGAKVTGAEEAVGFLAEHWTEIPEEMKLKFTGKNTPVGNK